MVTHLFFVYAHSNSNFHPTSSAMVLVGRLIRQRKHYETVKFSFKVLDTLSHKYKRLIRYDSIYIRMAEQ